MKEITVGLCEAFKEIGIDISEGDLRKFEKALFGRGLNVAPRVHGAPDGLANEVKRLKDLLVRTEVAVERCWSLEPGGPRKSRALSLLNEIRKLGVSPS